MKHSKTNSKAATAEAVQNQLGEFLRAKRDQLRPE